MPDSIVSMVPHLPNFPPVICSVTLPPLPLAFALPSPSPSLTAWSLGTETGVLPLGHHHPACLHITFIRKHLHVNPTVILLTRHPLVYVTLWSSTAFAFSFPFLDGPAGRDQDRRPANSPPLSSVPAPWLFRTEINWDYKCGVLT